MPEGYTYATSSDSTVWVTSGGSHHYTPAAADFQEYIDENVRCPTRQKQDQLTVKLAQQIYDFLVATSQISMEEHRDLIFESAQRIIRAVGADR